MRIHRTDLRLYVVFLRLAIINSEVWLPKKHASIFSDTGRYAPISELKPGFSLLPSTLQLHFASILAFRISPLLIYIEGTFEYEVFAKAYLIITLIIHVPR